MAIPAERFEEIFQTYYRSVSRFFTSTGSSSEDADDLTQETFLRVYRSLNDLNDASSIGAWLFEIANNTRRNEFRRAHAKRREPFGLAKKPIETSDTGAALNLASDDSPIQSLLTAEWREELGKALAELPPQMRRCMTLRIVQGASYREIAEVLQISIDAVKSQLFTGRRRLTAKIGSVFPDIDPSG